MLEECQLEACVNFQLKTSGSNFEHQLNKKKF